MGKMTGGKQTWFQREDTSLPKRKHKTFVQHFYNVGPTSKTLARANVEDAGPTLYKCFVFTGMLSSNIDILLTVKLYESKYLWLGIDAVIPTCNANGGYLCGYVKEKVSFCNYHWLKLILTIVPREVIVTGKILCCYSSYVKSFLSGSFMYSAPLLVPLPNVDNGCISDNTHSE